MASMMTETNRQPIDKRERRLARNQTIREANQRKLKTNRRTFVLKTIVMGPKVTEKGKRQ